MNNEFVAEVERQAREECLGLMRVCSEAGRSDLTVELLTSGVRLQDVDAAIAARGGAVPKLADAMAEMHGLPRPAADVTEPVRLADRMRATHAVKAVRE